MDIISIEDLKSEGLKMQLEGLIERNSPLIGDYFVVGGCFIPAVLRLGLKYDRDPDSPALIRIKLDPKEYNLSEEQFDAYDIIYKVKELREKIVEYVNDDLKKHAGDILPDDDDDKQSTKYHMIEFGFILSVVMPYAYRTWFGKDRNVDKTKSDFEWLIRELEQAGYSARFFTTPRNIKIQVSLPVKDNGGNN